MNPGKEGNDLALLAKRARVDMRIREKHCRKKRKKKQDPTEWKKRVASKSRTLQQARKGGQRGFQKYRPVS